MRKKTVSPASVILIQQALVGLGLLAVWEAAGVWSNSPWVSRPSLVFERLAEWLAGNLYVHAATTLAEMGAGLALGGGAGAVAGLLLGRSPVLAVILRPIIVALYSVPFVALAPLLIMFFGLYMMPKIVLVTIVVFFLVFFNTFSGVATIDRDLEATLELMGASRLERFRKAVAPGCMVWIVSGFKTALPYSLVAATTAEMLASTRGMGFLIVQSASRLDTAGLYAALLVLMILGLAVSEAGERIDRRLLHWRPLQA